MMKFPVGMQTFQQIRDEGCVYIDKTAMIYRLVKTGKVYFLSRPRRFGKSLLVSTLKSYFEGRKDLFEGLAIEQLEKDWFAYPVFHLDFNAEDFKVAGVLEQRLEANVSEWEMLYGESSISETIGGRFAHVLRQAHQKCGRRCVVLVDEYDKPLLDVMDTDLKTRLNGEECLLEDRNRDILKAFYSVFKLADADLQFVLLTGVTKFSQISVFSGFNQPDDISMIAEYDSLCGITQEEMEAYFAEPIAEMAAKYEVGTEEMLQRLKDMYDGYHFSEGMTDIYNPYSLLSAFKHKVLKDFWFRTGNPSYLVRLLAHSRENLNELTGKYYFPDEFVDYKANVERPLPMIYQSGYLTIKGYDDEFQQFLLDFPNKEVMRGFVSLVATDYFKATESVESWIVNIVRSMRQGEPDVVRNLFTSFFASIPYTAHRKKSDPERENYFTYTFYLIFKMVSAYAVYIEKEQSQGRSDCIVETPQYVYIFEFKLDGSADAALQQIEDKGYARPYLSDSRKLFKIGASFSSKTGTIEEWKVG